MNTTKTMTRMQSELAFSAFTVAAKRLEEIAAEVRKIEGVCSADVYVPSADEIESSIEDGHLLTPALTVECYRGHEASGLDLQFKITHIGDGFGQIGPQWVYAL